MWRRYNTSMPALLASLRDHDLGFLQIAAAAWGLTLQASDLESARAEFTEQLSDAELVSEKIAALPPDVLQALADILQHAGRMPWARWTRLHGALRQMGAARRAREKPHLQPVSAVERLHYLGLVARAFFDTPDGPQEFAYVPDDLLPLIPPISAAPEKPLGRPASEQESASQRLADDHILDEITTLLAAVRIGRDPLRDRPAAYQEFLAALLLEGGLLEPGGEPNVNVVRAFLESDRGAALAFLNRTWQAGARIDDLRLVPDLESEGEWRSDPQAARRSVLRFLDAVPEGVWWSLPGFIAGIRQEQPEFLRPDGDFDSWYLRSRATGAYLRGAGAWDSVEGALIAWLISGPLHWLGVVDLAGPSPEALREPWSGRRPAAFRTSRWSAALLAGSPPKGWAREEDRIHVRSDGQIRVPRHAPRAARYLVARFCDWDAPGKEEFRYRPSPSSLTRAADSGLRVDQLIRLLARHTDGIPPNVTLALKNWQKQGQAARIQTFPVLRLPSTEALEALRASRAARFLGDPLGPAAIALKPGSEQRVLAALVELGYLGEVIEP